VYFIFGIFLAKPAPPTHLVIHALQSYILSPQIVSEANYEGRDPCIHTLVHQNRRSTIFSCQWTYLTKRGGEPKYLPLSL